MKRTKNGAGLGLSRKGRQLISSNPRLFTISEKERQLLLSERVANILEHSFKFEDYKVYLTQEKNSFGEVPERLQRFREEESPLWRKSSLPFEVDQEEEYLRKLTESNQVKILKLHDVPKSVHNKSIVKQEQAPCTEVDSEEADLFESSRSPEEPKTPVKSSSNNASQVENAESSSAKKLYPLFKPSQTQTRVIKSESSTSSSQFNMACNASFDSDLETPKKPHKSRFHLWGSKKEKGERDHQESKPLLNKSATATAVNNTEWRPPPTSKSDHKDLAQDMLSLFLEKTDADLTVYGREEKPIRAHKLIVKVRCPKLLKEMVLDNSSKSDRKREIIPLTCFSHTAVKCLMCFIYCGRLLPTAFKLDSLTPKEMDEIIELGNKYGINLTPDPDPVVAVVPKKITEQQTAATQTTASLLVDTEEKSIQTDETEIEREEFLNDARIDERSFPYLNKSMDYNHSNNSNSPDLFEDSFNDKVYANKLDDSGSIRKRRRTWSDKSLKMSSDSEDSDCIIVCSNKNDDNQQQEQYNEAVKSQNSSSISRKSNNLNSLTIPTTPRRSLSPIGTNYGTELFIPDEPTWSKSCDDTFFANLPADEDLLNMPPTSPSGYGRASPILPTSPISIVRPSSPASSSTATDSYSRPSTADKSGRHPPGKKGRKASSRKSEPTSQHHHHPPAKKTTRRGKQSQQQKASKSTAKSKVDDDYFRFDSDDDEDLARALSQQAQGTPKQVTPPPPPPRRRSKGQSQPQQQTPMLNYSLIDTPILKNELKRYGLKPLPRSKAKIILKHIYVETHK